MLRITVRSDPSALTFRLEGKLIGPWVRELENCWQSTRGSQRTNPVRFDLTGVTFVDAAGKAFLAARHAEGAELVASGCLMRAVVAEIANAAIPGGANREIESQTETQLSRGTP
jgi:anti-anti-sigma regulatory factor